MEKHKKRPKNGWRISLPRGLLIPCELFNRTTEAWTGTALCPRDRQVGPGWTKVAVTIATLCILMPYAIRQGNGFAVDSGGVMLRRWGLWCPTCRKDAKRGRFGKCGAVGPSITQHDAHSGFIESLIQISYWFREFATLNMFSLHFSLVQFGPNYLGALPVAVRVKLSGQRLWTRTTHPMHQIVTDSPTIL